MKTLKTIFAVCLIGVFTLTSCKYKAGDHHDVSSAEIDSVSYSLGVWFGGTVKSTDFGEINLSQVKKGAMDMLNDKDLKISEDQIMGIIQNYLTERQAWKAEKSIAEGKDFLEKNGKKEGVVTLEDGLQYKIISEGTGATPTDTDTMEVNYVGKFVNGEEFDSSYKRNQPMKFPFSAISEGGLIKGWKALQYAKEGGKIEIYIPSELAYGPQTNGPIPANSVLVFEVEVLKITPASAATATEEMLPMTEVK